jgi:hypothetical protein
MGNLKTFRKDQDPIIMAVLDQIYCVSQIDTTFLNPDSKLTQDLGLDRVQVQTVLFRSAQDLKLQIPFESCRVEDSSARQLVAILRQWCAATGNLRAS